MMKTMSNGEQQMIIDRAPFTRSGEVTVSAKQKNVAFSGESTTHNMDRDFEVPHLTFKLTALAKGAVCDPQPDVLDRLFQVRAINVSTSHWVGNALPLTRVSDGIYRWAPIKSFVFRRGDSMSICVDARDSFDIAFDGKRRNVDEIRVELAFEGELLTYAQRSSAMSDVGVEAPLG